MEEILLFLQKQPIQLKTIQDEVTSTRDYALAWERISRWRDITASIIREKISLTESGRFKEYAYYGSSFDNPLGDIQWVIGQYSAYLKALAEEVEMNPDFFTKKEISTKTERDNASPLKTGAKSGKKVFVVHGHDHTTKLNVARLLEKLELVPLILHEQANRGRTLIEKFEDYSDVAYAVVLLTPDDMGAANGGEPAPRARQNVIFELGYFMGKIERNKVCALYSKGVEIPSDHSGIIYVELDEAGAWQLGLAREMIAAGLDIDLNKLV